MPGEQLIERPPVTRVALIEQPPGFRGIGLRFVHGASPTLLTCKRKWELTIEAKEIRLAMIEAKGNPWLLMARSGKKFVYAGGVCSSEKNAFGQTKGA